MMVLIQPGCLVRRDVVADKDPHPLEERVPFGPMSKWRGFGGVLTLPVITLFKPTSNDEQHSSVMADLVLQ
jgi:hypothetical protein